MKQPKLTLLLAVAFVGALSPSLVAAENCGPNAGGASCPSPMCCSQYGYCGATMEYCNVGCQAAYGSCATDTCGDGVCDPASESCSTCAADCGACPPVENCGNGVCSTSQGESCSSCPADCGVCGNCGDGFCDVSSGETCTGCPADCGSCPNADGTCGSNGNGASCPTGQCCSTYGWCGTDAAYCSANNGCQAAFGSCWAGCGDGVCDATSGESCLSCAADCGPCAPASCGNGVCENTFNPANGETCGSCPADCGPCQTSSLIAACRNRKHFALTFDDGPSYVTPTLMNTLRSRNIPATFFVVGTMVKNNPAIFADEASGDFSIASHSYSHPHSNNLQLSAVYQEYLDADTEIRKHTCFTPRVYRPPYGEMNAARRAMMRDFGFQGVLWNLDTKDYLLTSGNTPQQLLAKLAADIDANPNQGILHLQHDLLEQSVNLVPEIIDVVESKGRQFVSLEECIYGPNYQSHPAYVFARRNCPMNSFQRRLQTSSSCPVSEWADWSPCDSPCGVGWQTRVRMTMPPGLEKIDPRCSALQYIQTRECTRKRACSHDAEYSEWSAWSECSATCAGGTQTSRRSMVRFPTSGGSIAALTRTRICNDKPCEIGEQPVVPLP